MQAISQKTSLKNKINKGGKKWVLRRALKIAIEVQFRRRGGTELQIVGVAKAKARLPCFDLIKGILGLSLYFTERL